MEDFVNVRALFDSMVSIAEEDWLFIKGRLRPITFNRNDIITQFGQVENKLYFLATGIVRHVMNNPGETTVDFAFPGQFFSSYSSFISRAPSKYEIRPVSGKIETLYISYDNLQEIYQNTACGEKMGRMAAEQQFLKKSKREYSLLALNPAERYAELLKEQPHLLQHIPLKYLASYLGVTPETLSRIRSSIS